MTVKELNSSRGLLVDTNLLLLLVIGALSPEQIGNHKRTNKYSVEDYRLLLAFVDRFRIVITTPNILTETSNLLGEYSYQGQQGLQLLERVAQVMQEVYYESMPTMAAYSACYLKFGLSDTAIQCAAKENYLVLTDDLNFCAYLQGQGLLALNFNNLRSGYILG